MNKFINNQEFMAELFDDQSIAERAGEIGDAILAARSLRLTDIAVEMEGESTAGYKRIQRFLKTADPRTTLWRLFQEDAEFIIGDPTEIERTQAWKTEYVGTLKDGKTKGFWALVLATPYRGRAIPCGLVTYSSKTIAQNGDSRNLNHFRAFETLKDMLGERPLVLDREFSYLELMLNLVEEQVNWVIRLNLRANPPKFYDQDGDAVALTISPGETVIHNHIWYMGKVRVNLVGTWKKGLDEPLWVMTNLTAKEGLRIYFARMKIEIVCTQMTKAGVFTIGAGWDDIADFNFFIVNDYSIDQQFYQLPTLFKIQFIQSWLNTLAELLDVVCQCKGLNLLLGLVLHLFQLLLETVLDLSQFLMFSLKFVSQDDFRQVHFQETLLLTFEACQGLTDGVSFGLQGLWQPFSRLGAFQFMGNQIWPGYNVAEILPDKFIERLGWHITGSATFALSGSMNITSPSACVIVVTPLETASRRQMALTATDQTAEKVIVALVVAAGHILVFLQARLSSIKYFLIKDGWNSDFNPLLW
jgi:hypothetical protein